MTQIKAIVWQIAYTSLNRHCLGCVLIETKDVVFTVVSLETVRVVWVVSWLKPKMWFSQRSVWRLRVVWIVSWLKPKMWFSQWSVWRLWGLSGLCPDWNQRCGFHRGQSGDCEGCLDCVLIETKDVVFTEVSLETVRVVWIVSWLRPKMWFSQRSVWRLWGLSGLCSDLKPKMWFSQWSVWRLWGLSGLCPDWDQRCGFHSGQSGDREGCLDCVLIETKDVVFTVVSLETVRVVWIVSWLKPKLWCSQWSVWRLWGLSGLCPDWDQRCGFHSGQSGDCEGCLDCVLIETKDVVFTVVSLETVRVVWIVSWLKPKMWFSQRSVWRLWGLSGLCPDWNQRCGFHSGQSGDCEGCLDCVLIETKDVVFTEVSLGTVRVVWIVSWLKPKMWFSQRSVWRLWGLSGLCPDWDQRCGFHSGQSGDCEGCLDCVLIETKDVVFTEVSLETVRVVWIVSWLRPKMWFSQWSVWRLWGLSGLCPDWNQRCGFHSGQSGDCEGCLGCVLIETKDVVFTVVSLETVRVVWIVFWLRPKMWFSQWSVWRLWGLSGLCSDWDQRCGFHSGQSGDCEGCLDCVLIETKDVVFTEVSLGTVRVVWIVFWLRPKMWFSQRSVWRLWGLSGLCSDWDQRCGFHSGQSGDCEGCLGCVLIETKDVVFTEVSLETVRVVWIVFWLRPKMWFSQWSVWRLWGLSGLCPDWDQRCGFHSGQSGDCEGCLDCVLIETKDVVFTVVSLETVRVVWIVFWLRPKMWFSQWSVWRLWGLSGLCPDWDQRCGFHSGQSGDCEGCLDCVLIETKDVVFTVVSLETVRVVWIVFWLRPKMWFSQWSVWRLWGLSGLCSDWDQRCGFHSGQSGDCEGCLDCVLIETKDVVFTVVSLETVRVVWIVFWLRPKMWFSQWSVWRLWGLSGLCSDWDQRCGFHSGQSGDCEGCLDCVLIETKDVVFTVVSLETVRVVWIVFWLRPKMWFSQWSVWRLWGLSGLCSDWDQRCGFHSGQSGDCEGCLDCVLIETKDVVFTVVSLETVRVVWIVSWLRPKMWFSQWSVWRLWGLSGLCSDWDQRCGFHSGQSGDCEGCLDCVLIETKDVVFTVVSLETVRVVWIVSWLRPKMWFSQWSVWRLWGLSGLCPDWDQRCGFHRGQSGDCEGCLDCVLIETKDVVFTEVSLETVRVVWIVFWLKPKMWFSQRSVWRLWGLSGLCPDWDQRCGFHSGQSGDCEGCLDCVLIETKDVVFTEVSLETVRVVWIVFWLRPKMWFSQWSVWRLWGLSGLCPDWDQRCGFHRGQSGDCEGCLDCVLIETKDVVFTVVSLETVRVVWIVSWLKPKMWFSQRSVWRLWGLSGLCPDWDQRCGFHRGQSGDCEGCLDCVLIETKDVVFTEVSLETVRVVWIVSWLRPKMWFSQWSVWRLWGLSGLCPDWDQRCGFHRGQSGDCEGCLDCVLIETKDVVFTEVSLETVRVVWIVFWLRPKMWFSQWSVWRLWGLSGLCPDWDQRCGFHRGQSGDCEGCLDCVLIETKDVVFTVVSLETVRVVWIVSWLRPKMWFSQRSVWRLWGLSGLCPDWDQRCGFHSGQSGDCEGCLDCVLIETKDVVFTEVSLGTVRVVWIVSLIETRAVVHHWFCSHSAVLYTNLRNMSYVPTHPNQLLSAGRATPQHCHLPINLLQPLQTNTLCWPSTMVLR